MNPLLRARALTPFCHHVNCRRKCSDTLPRILQRNPFGMQTPSASNEPARRASARAAAPARALSAACLLLACLLNAAAWQPALATNESSAKSPSGQGPAVQIVPAPKSLTATGENFPLKRGARVVLADPKSEDDRFAAEDFADDVRETAQVSLRVATGGGRGQILVGPLSSPRVRAAVERAG